MRKSNTWKKLLSGVMASAMMLTCASMGVFATDDVFENKAAVEYAEPNEEIVIEPEEETVLDMTTEVAASSNDADAVLVEELVEDNEKNSEEVLYSGSGVLDGYESAESLYLVAGRDYTFTPKYVRGSGEPETGEYRYALFSTNTSVLQVEPSGSMDIDILEEYSNAKIEENLFPAGTSFTVRIKTNFYDGEEYLMLWVLVFKYDEESKTWKSKPGRGYYVYNINSNDIWFQSLIAISKEGSDESLINPKRLAEIKEQLGAEYNQVTYDIAVGQTVGYDGVIVPDQTINGNEYFSYDPGTGVLRATATYEKFKSLAESRTTEEYYDMAVQVTGTLYGETIFLIDGKASVDLTKVIYVTNPRVVKKATAQATAEKITLSKKPTQSKPKAAAKGKVTISWKKFKQTKKTKAIWKKIKKVEVQYSTDPGFKTGVTRKLVGKSKTKLVVKKLNKNTTYYVRVRYTDGAGGYSNWSATKKVKTKKK